jgi:hypothetical protein
MIYLQLGRLVKLMTTHFKNLGWDLPPDILDDDMVAQAVVGQSAATAAPPGGGGGAEAGPQGLPAVGQTPAVNPIQPIDQGGATKQSSVLDIFSSRAPEGDMTALSRNLDIVALLRSCQDVVRGSQ